MKRKDIILSKAIKKFVIQYVSITKIIDDKIMTNSTKFSKFLFLHNLKHL